MSDILVFIGCLILIVIALLIYLIPTIIAFKRGHRNRFVIMAINIALGGTLIAWLGALIWALNRVDSPIKGGSKYDPDPQDPLL